MSKTKITWIVVIVAVIIIVIIAAVWMNAHTAKAPAINDVISSSTAQMNTPTSSASSSTPAGSGTVKGAYSTGDYSIAFPPAWTISSYKPFEITTFKGQYADGNVIPKGGAEIDIATTTVYDNLESIIQTELSNAKNVAMLTKTVDGTACAAASYNSTYGGSVASDVTAVYCAKGNELWKIYFSYRADDTTANVHVNDFTSILGSMKLL